MKMKKTILKIAASALCVCAGIVMNPCVSHADNPIVQTYYTADPASLVTSDGEFYVYTGHDEDVTVDGFYTMIDWRAYSSTDMVNWTDRGTVLKLSDFKWAKQDGQHAWAAQVVERNGKFYYYVCVIMQDGSGFGIGVAVADNPYGPFKDAIGAPLIKGTWRDIDPTVYVDDDGQAYMYYSQSPLKYVLLNEDMISYDTSVGDKGIVSEEPKSVGLTSYVEAPWLYSRNDASGNKKYYMVYAGTSSKGGGEDIRYATSDSPLGPWVFQNVIMEPGSLSAVNDGKGHGSFTIHPGITDYKGHSYFVYHNAALANGGGYHRSVAIEEFTYGEDGSIPLIKMTLNDRKAIGTLNPYCRNEAETICWEYGIKTEDDINSDGQIEVDVYNIHDDDYIKVESVDFGNDGPISFTASVKNAMSDAGAYIELYVKDEDNVEGVNSLELSDAVKIGELAVDNTSSDWKEITTAISEKVTGVHDLYIVFKGNYAKPVAEEDPAAVISEEDTGMFKFDYWKFDKKDEPVPTDNTQVIQNNGNTGNIVSNVPPVGNAVTPPTDNKTAAKVSKPARVAGIKAKVSGKSIKISWKKRAGDKQYKVYYSNKKKGKYTLAATVKSNSYKFRKGKKGKTYYFKVRAVNKAGTGKYSKVIKAAIK